MIKDIAGNKQKKDVTVVGLGEILWDVLPDEKQLGGAPANFAYFSNCFGYQGIAVSKVGNDALGREILDQLNRKWVSTEYITVDCKHPTSTVTVDLDSEGVPDYTIHENVAWDYLNFNEKTITLAKMADVVCYGSLASRHPNSSASIDGFLKATSKECLKVFDLNIRKHFFLPKRLKALLGFADILKLNQEEISLISTLFSLQGAETDVLKRLLDEFNLDLVILTKGAEGSRLFSLEEDNEYPGTQLESIVDTVGAGDSFTATVIAGLLENRSLATINKQANRVAAHVCSKKGAMPDVPAELLQF